MTSLCLLLFTGLEAFGVVVPWVKAVASVSYNQRL